MGLASEKIQSIQERRHEDTDTAYTAQKLKRSSLKDELTEKFLSMYQTRQEEVLFLRKENEELLRRVEGSLHQIETLKHHKDCEAKVTLNTHFYMSISFTFYCI